MRRACKTDNNHAEIRDKLRADRWWVFDTHALGDGFPDLCVIAPGCIVLLEVKQPGERLTGDHEPLLHAHAEAIAAPVFVVHSYEEAKARIWEVMRG